MPSTQHFPPNELKYLKDEDRLALKYPNLRSESGRPWNAHNPYRQSRAAILTFSENGQPHIRSCETPESLRTGLADRSLVSQSRRLIILEGLDPEWKTILGANLGVPHDFWMHHANTYSWEKITDGEGNVPYLPSTSDATTRHTFNYRQMIKLNFEHEKYGLRCAENYRGIAWTEQHGQPAEVATVNRKLSCWAREARPTSWTAVLLVDQPFKTAITRDTRNGAWHAVSPPSEPALFQGGYVDFMPYTDLKDVLSTSGPSRQSMFDDLIYYHSYHWQALSLTSDSASVTVFADKIIASEYMILLQYYRSLLSSLHLGITRQEDYSEALPKWAAQSWTSLLATQRRLQEDQDRVRSIINRIRHNVMDRTAISANVDGSVHDSRWSNSLQDFNHIESHLSLLLGRIDGLITSFSALSNAQAAGQSLLEARDVRYITLLGMVFLPASLIAAIFSMSEDFGPGRPHFWIYFAIAIPISLCLLLTAGFRNSLVDILRSVVKTTKEISP